MLPMLYEISQNFHGICYCDNILEAGGTTATGFIWQRILIHFEYPK